MRMRGGIFEGREVARSDGARVATISQCDQPLRVVEIGGLDPNGDVEITFGQAAFDSRRADMANVGRGRKGGPELRRNLVEQATGGASGGDRIVAKPQPRLSLSFPRCPQRSRPSGEKR